MAKLSHLLESFFKSDTTSFEKHKKSQEDVERIQSYVQGLKSFYLALNGKKIEVIKESFASLLPIFESYKSDKLFAIEKDIAVKLNDAKDETVIADIMKLFGQVKEVLVENKAPEAVINEISVDTTGTPDRIEPPKDVPVEPAKTIEPVVADGTAEPTPEQKQSAIEDGFNEGRKWYRENFDKPEANAKSHVNQLAETVHADRPYKWVTNYMSGFNQGCKFEETIQRDLNPDKFPKEDEQA